jgi:hypothetical protein
VVGHGRRLTPAGHGIPDRNHHTSHLDWQRRRATLLHSDRATGRFQPHVPSSHLPPLRRLQPLVWLVLLITGLGLSRWAVQCRKPCCAGHVKLVASCDTLTQRPATTTDCSCCSHAHPPGQNQRHDRDHDRERAPRSEGRDCGCEHVRLCVELAENPPTDRRLCAPPDTNAGQPHTPAHLPTASLRPRPHPTATGPPPHARRCAHRTSIQLLL